MTKAYKIRIGSKYWIVWAMDIETAIQTFRLAGHGGKISGFRKLSEIDGLYPAGTILPLNTYRNKDAGR